MDLGKDEFRERRNADDVDSRSVMRTLLARRSIRDGFTNQPLPLDVLRAIVRGGLAAPSSKNAQPWCLHVVSDAETLRALADAVEFSEGADTYVPRDPATGKPRPDWPSTVAESAAVLRSVSTAIFVENRGVFSSGRRTLGSATGANLAGSLVGYTFEILGIGAAIENMWIAANAFGVDGTYMGDVVIAEEEIGRRLQIDGDLVGVLALGYVDPSIPRRVSEPDVANLDRVVWHQAAATPQPSDSRLL